MRATVVIGTQWGDEGKGKVVDLLAADADVVVRFHGGNNAGHTLVVNGEKTVLNLIPSGVLHPGRVCMLGPGVVIGGRSEIWEVPVIEDFVQIGVGAKVLGPVRVGRGACIGANAVVLHDVPPGAVVGGIPAKILRMRGPDSAPASAEESLLGDTGT